MNVGVTFTVKYDYIFCVEDGTSMDEIKEKALDYLEDETNHTWHDDCTIDVLGDY